MATAQMYPDFSGFCNVNKGLGKTPLPYFSTKLKPLGSLGQDGAVIVYGDEATLDFMDSLRVPFGSAIPTTVDTLQTGYSYIWNIGKGILKIINEVSVVIFERKITAWCDLAIEATILESHQFQYVIDASYTPDAFLIAIRQPTNRNCDAMVVMWGEFEQYLKSEFHVVYKRLYKWFDRNGDSDESGKNDIGSDPYSCKGGIEELRTFINALIIDLSQSGKFSKNIYIADAGGTGKRVRINRIGMVTTIGKYLMIKILSASMLLGNKHCYEPWMLWEMFKWLSQNSNIEIEDRIFDLSPWWG